MGDVQLAHALQQRVDQVRGFRWRWRIRLACQHLRSVPTRMGEHRDLLPHGDLLDALGPLGEVHGEHALGAQGLGPCARTHAREPLRAHRAQAPFDRRCDQVPARWDRVGQ
jgi:hypothetical protein